MPRDNRTRYTDNEATNTSLGQVGSVFLDTASAIVPPSGLSFIAITVLTDATTFASTDGLVPEDGDGKTYISTEVASDSVTSGGTYIDVTNEFPAGITIFGRWSKITLGSAGTIIAYVG